MLFKKNTMINNSYDYSSNAINGYSWYMYSSNYCYNGFKTNKQKTRWFLICPAIRPATLVARPPP